MLSSHTQPLTAYFVPTENLTRLGSAGVAAALDCEPAAGAGAGPGAAAAGSVAAVLEDEVEGAA